MWNEPLARYAGNAIHGLDLSDDPRYRVEVHDEDRYTDIVWTEYLAFHRELADRDHARWPDMPSWSTFTVDGWLTAENERVLCDELSRLTGIADIGTEECDDEPNITFSIRTEYLEGETVTQWFDRIGWPVVAELTNCTDPGTFNHPYLFSAMLYRKVEL